MVADTKLIPYDDSEKAMKPLNIVLTEFHILVLYQDRLKAYCRLNEELVYDDPYTGIEYRLLVNCYFLKQADLMRYLAER